jgi:hypothetical protein
MRVQKKLSEDEIKRRLVDDAQNSDAWEPPIKVAPSQGPRPAQYGQVRVSERRIQALKKAQRMPKVSDVVKR